MTPIYGDAVKTLHKLGLAMSGVLLGGALLVGAAHADEAVELCSGGDLRTVDSGQTVRHDVQPGADLNFLLRQPVKAGSVDYLLDNVPASLMEIQRPSRKQGVLLIMCRTARLNGWVDTEILRVVKLQPGLRAQDFIPIVNSVPVQEGDRFLLRVIAIPREAEERSRLRSLMRSAVRSPLVPGFIVVAGVTEHLSLSDLMRSPISDNSDLPFGLQFSLDASAAPVPDAEQQAEATDETATEDDTSNLTDLLGEMFAGVQSPSLAGNVLADLAFGPMQSEAQGYFSAPATAPVGSMVPIDIHYGDRATFDNIVLVRQDLDDDSIRGPDGRNMFRISDEDRVYRRAGDEPGIYELRLRRQEASEYRIMARQQIELVDVDIDLQVPDAVTTRQEFEVFMNPVMDGHLVIRFPHRADDDVVNAGARQRNAVEAAEGPGVFTRRAPREVGEYEVRFHFNPPRRFRDERNQHGRLIARTTLNVVSRDEIDEAAPEEVAEDLAGIEAQIEELSASIEEVTLAQTQELRTTIEALGLPALLLLAELVMREAVAPQLVFALTTPLPPEQWAGGPAAPAAIAPAPAATPPTASTPSAAYPETTAPQPQAQATPAGYAVTGVAADDMLNVRSGPGVGNMITGMLPPNATGILPTGQSAQSADGGTWWQIADPALPGGTGWVNARFLAPAQAAPPQQAATEQPVEAHSAEGPDPAQYHQVTGIAANEVLYLRSDPAPDAPIVSMLPPDATEISITGAQQSSQDGRIWLQIHHANAPDGGMAWVEAAYLEQMDPLPSIAQVAQDFTHSPGMNDFDPYKLEQSIANILHYAADSALAPGYDLSPLTKSIVALQAIDGRLPHARYHLTYRQGEATLSPDGSFDLVDLVELRRFNLGPARHAATVAAYGAENTADIAQFGEGPDVVWRFAMRPLRGNHAVILSAARAEIDAPEGDCMGFHCQMAQPVVPHMGDWGDETSIAMPEFRPSYDELWQGAPSAPAVLDALALTAHMATADGSDARWNPVEPRMMEDPGDPFIEVIVEVGMGQDAGVEVGFFETRLRDDELMSVWYRLGAFGGPGQHHVIWSSTAERWPHRQ